MLKFKLIGPSPLYLNGMGNPSHESVPLPNFVMSHEALELHISHMVQSNGIMNSVDLKLLIQILISVPFKTNSC